MSNDFDFESNVQNNGPINNGPVNNGGNGGVPLIAIIGVMALIIVGLIVYIIVNPGDTKDEAISNVDDYTYQLETEFEEEYSNYLEDEENNVEEELVDDDENVKEEKKNDVDDTKNTTKTPIQTTTSSNAKLSDDWTSGEFAIEGKPYKLNSDYSTLVDNGWYIDLVEMGYSDGYILNKNDKTYSTVDLYNDDFEDADVSIGFINNGDGAKDITESQFWAINVDNSYSDTPVEFELPGGIKTGSTLAEIEAVYGKPEEDDIYRSDDLGYTNYSYVYDYSIYLDLTVYDDKGLVEFDYKIY